MPHQRSRPMPEALLDIETLQTIVSRLRAAADMLVETSDLIEESLDALLDAEDEEDALLDAEDEDEEYDND
jgi:chromatin segregation and condensation protein Rec8/ScpA/Scc1 (kleisin family)